jgi:hypothetical protein
MFKVLLTVSPSRPSFFPPAGVSSQPCLAIQPNFYPSGASSFLSITCRLLVSLCSLFGARFLCFQQVAASFAKMPGVGGTNAFSASAFAPSASLRYPLSKGLRRRQSCSSTNSFRINTCKSVSKQTTLTPFRINTCEKTGGGRGWQ